MKERPILMSTESVKAILDRLKTQTRRTQGLEEINKNPNDWDFMRFNEGGVALFWRSPETASNNPEDPDNIRLIKCPYGQVGDRLWVRETTWYYEGSRRPHYVATEQPNKLSRHFGKVKPSIHMFRKDSRILREITEIRAERVQDISEEDAIAEGIERHTDSGDNIFWFEVASDYHGDTQSVTAIEAFGKLWDSLNAKRGHGWDKNDWVWPISFKKID